MRYGIPTFGTMAHSFVMLFDREIDSFRAFVKTFPDKSTLLIDTFDDVKGAEKAAIVAKELEKKGFRLRAVRLDSGDLAEISRKVRELLDERGLKYVNIFASGDLDEYRIEELLRKGAKIDAFGVGTRMGTSADKPYVDVIYKLSEKMNEKGEFSPIMKLSKGKVTLPGKKQVFRLKDKRGNFVEDIIAVENERIEGEPLLAKVMENGKIACNLPTLDGIRERALENVSRLPEEYKKLRAARKYPVKLSLGLRKLTKELTEKLRRDEVSDPA
jgi:nicotinate phosphoribosyltransferase